MVVPAIWVCAVVELACSVIQSSRPIRIAQGFVRIGSFSADGKQRDHFYRNYPQRHGRNHEAFPGSFDKVFVIHNSMTLSHFVTVANIKLSWQVNVVSRGGNWFVGWAWLSKKYLYPLYGYLRAGVMSIGNSGRVVIEMEPELKKQLHAVLRLEAQPIRAEESLLLSFVC